MLRLSIGSLRLAAATALLATTPAFAQSTGQITGVVKDSTGAVLPGATVTVTGADGAKHEASTSADGAYTVSGLPPGNYTVSFGRRCSRTRRWPPAARSPSTSLSTPTSRRRSRSPR
ncbi:MAG: carboxypeptidase-like regulatory domain-containing protein [Myxococcales bacterium]|nr:carboxypeptidase-like regulatory domain-containing protein [Myxococcales bacterium]